MFLSVARCQARVGVKSEPAGPSRADVELRIVFGNATSSSVTKKTTYRAFRNRISRDERSDIKGNRDTLCICELISRDLINRGDPAWTGKAKTCFSLTYAERWIVGEAHVHEHRRATISMHRRELLSRESQQEHEEREVMGDFGPRFYSRSRNARAVSTGRVPSIPEQSYKHFIPVGHSPPR